ncbi:MAG TPA: DNA double-strand break repair nuclease NurA [Candidatus Eremiobacteraeota bacterium]|nr:DNA double-strand break repair nuclease NurA [Candidatus Eremiobacteraeota bacterium]
MLDLGQLRKQIKEMLKEKVENKSLFLEKLKQAWVEFSKWEKDWEKIKNKVEEAKTSWLLAKLFEPFHTKVIAPERPKELTLIATDGSQIFPDYHEISSCYLINTGYIILHYGTGEKPLMASEAVLYYRDRDLYEQFNGRRISVNPSIVSARRGLLEIEKLTSLLLNNKERKDILGLVDGTLILWTLEGSAPDFKDKILQTFLKNMDSLKEANIPIAAYISRPRTNDVINTLRVGLCPQLKVNCDKCPYKDDLFLPCSPIEGITDALLFNGILKEKERSPLFESTSNILSQYGEHKVLFFYIHTGQEIGRVEIPLWMGEEKKLLDLTHSVVYDQVKKGGGYPVALSEAHEKAVIRGPDRELFYKMISDSLIEEKIPLKMSAKKASKEIVRI